MRGYLAGEAGQIPHTSALQQPHRRERRLNPGGFGVDAEDFFHDVDDFAQGGVGVDGFEEIGHGVLGALAGNAQAVEGLPDAAGVAGAAQLFQAGDLARVALRVHLEDGDGHRLAVGVGVDSDDLADALVDLLLVAIGGFGDLGLEEAFVDGGQHAAQLLDAAEVSVDLSLDAVRLGFDEEGAAQRVDGVGYARLFGDDLLGTQGDGDGVLGGQGQGFVHTVGMQGLGAAQHSGQGLEGDAHDIVLGLLGGERDPGGLGVEAHQPGARVLGAEGLTHLTGPDAAGGAVFGDLFEEVVVGVEEERQARGELIDIQAALQRPAHVLEPIGQGKGELLGSGGAGLADMVAGDADGVPLGDAGRAVFDGIHHQAHGGLGGEDILFLGDILFEDVVLEGAAQLVGAHALLLGGGDVHGPDDGGGRVDGHAGGDFVQGDILEQDLHILERGDGDPAGAELAQGFGGVGVVAHQGGEVEGDGEAGLALAQEVFEASVGLFGGAEPGEHAHGPQPAAVQGGVDAAGVGVFAGQAQVHLVIETG